MEKRRATAVGFLFFLAISAAACSRAPQDNIIKQAITESLEKNKSWSIGSKRVTGPGGLKLGTDIKVESVDVKQIGNFNEQNKYWPVKAKVKGTYQSNLIIVSKTDQFDEELDFKLIKDDYGNWKAVLVEE